MKNICIIKVTTDAIVSLQEISRLTFYETFEPHNSRENLSAYIDSAFSVEKLTQELLHPHTEFYFAYLDNLVIGYLKINIGEAQTETKQDHSLEIQRIYVKQAFQGRRVGYLLYEYALERAKAYGCVSMWLGVWEKNVSAIAFYQKQGLVAYDTHVFTLGEEKQIDILMRQAIHSK